MNLSARPLRRQRPAANALYAPPRDLLQPVKLAYCAALLMAALVQVAFFYRAESNLLVTLLATGASLLGITHALDGERFRAHPVSALILLMYTTTSTAAALLVKSLEFAPLVEQLEVPLTTYSVLLVGQFAVLLADRVYLRSTALQQLRRLLSRQLIAKAGVMRWPLDGELWILGFLGCASVVLTGTDYESGASFGVAGAGLKLIRAFGFLKFAPFLIPFRNALSGEPAPPRLPMLPLAAYFVLLVGISFATNSRSTFADTIPTVAIFALIARSQGRLDLRRIGPGTLIAAAAIALLAGMLLSRVSLAMVVVRDYRNTLDVGSLVRMTVEAFFNTDWLESAKARMEASTYLGNYSETYVQGKFFARFILTKFHDNVLYYFSLMGPDQVASYKEFMLDRLAGTLPDPLLRILGIALDKKDLVVSNGDYVVYLVDGWGLGGFKTGSMIGEVWGVFGPWLFGPVIFASALLLFVFHDAFVMVTKYQRLAFSPVILLLIWNLCGTTAAFGLGAESVTAIPAGIVRGLPQNVLFYMLATFGLRLLGRAAGRR